LLEAAAAVAAAGVVGVVEEAEAAEEAAEAAASEAAEAAAAAEAGGGEVALGEAVAAVPPGGRAAGARLKQISTLNPGSGWPGLSVSTGAYVGFACQLRAWWLIG
jgi:hypothetical protein